MLRLVVILLFCLPRTVEARTDFDRMEQLAAAEYGKNAASTVKAWRTLIEKNREQPNLTKLKQVNSFVNDRIVYASDKEVWGMEDYWTTPLEVFGKGRGDCEDYAIAKYISLLLMDVPVQKLRLVYVRARMGSKTVAHMVLSYFENPTDDPLILDNLTDTILPAKRRSDLFPIFSFNHDGLWIGGERGSTGDPSARLSRWRDVLQRMRREGIDPSLTQLNPQARISWEQPISQPPVRNVAQAQPKPQTPVRNAAQAQPKPRTPTKKAAATQTPSTTKVSANKQSSPKTKKAASNQAKSPKSKAKTAQYSPPSQKVVK
ncbi:MAG: transglutaminase-like cysteine peptidase [Betaproteobacteria bacterium]|nr:transglutaminase-like cysteine peptidase [Betaproteobacteria bacterium]